MGQVARPNCLPLTLARHSRTRESRQCEILRERHEARVARLTPLPVPAYFAAAPRRANRRPIRSNEAPMLANDGFHIAVIPGDGIGHEVMAPALTVLRQVASETPGLHLRFTETPAAAAHYRDHGVSMPESTVRLCEEAD